MRQRRRADSLIAILVAAVVLALAGATEAVSASRSFAMMRGPMMRGPVTSRMTIAPRRFAVPNRRFVPRLSKFPKTNTMVRTPSHSIRPVGNIKYPRRPVAGISVGPGGSDTGTRPGGRNPRGPRGPFGPGRFGPGIPAVVIGTGVAVGAGVGIGTAGPAGTPPGGFTAPGGPQGPGGPRNGISIPPPNENSFVKNEVVLVFANNYSPAAVARLLARHRLVRLEQQNFTLTDSTYVRVRIPDRRSVRRVLRSLAGEATLRFGQANFLFRASQQSSAVEALPQLQPPPGAATPHAAPPINSPPQLRPSPTATPQPTPVAAPAATPPDKGDPAQYALDKLHLSEAHRLALGRNILVAVIDSGVDVSHPELAGSIADTYDALGSGEKPHKHGTAIAGAIVAHSRLLGVAPSARILAIRAFSSKGASAEATTFAILKGLEYAATHGARIINMSFTGPFDPGLGRQLAAAHAKGAVLIAAAGNLGPKSPPQYPAADANVIAVTATDADDNLFAAANRGSYVAVAAPGVDIILPAPQGSYWMASGTSFAAAHVSGIAALILSRQPALTPDAVQQILLATAHDLGPPGRDPQFGAGLADAYRAILSIGQGTASVVAPIPMASEKQ